MNAVLTVSFWLVWGLGAIAMTLIVAGAVIAACQLVWYGFDVEPVRDRNDTDDPWLVDDHEQEATR